VWAIAVLALLLGACTPIEARQRAAILQVYQDVRNGHVERVMALMPEVERTAGMARGLAVAASLPRRDVRAEVNLLGVARQRTPQGEVLHTRHQYLYPDRVIVATTDMAFPSGDSPPLLLGFHLDGGAESAIARNRFTLSSKSGVHYAMLGAIALVGGVMIAGAVLVVARLRTPWRFALAAWSFVGVGLASLDWASGVLAIQLASVSVWKVGVFNGGGLLDPWVAQAPFPLGAIVALIAAFAFGRRALRGRSAP